jgi:heme/copper-type cytochrome/quinol oxidase subunit 2
MAAPPTKVRSGDRRFLWSSLALVAGLFGLVMAFTLWVPWNCRGAPTEGPFSGPGPCIGVLTLLAIPIFLLLELAAVVTWILLYFAWSNRRALRGRRRSRIEIPAVLMFAVVAAFLLLAAACGEVMTALPPIQ